MAWTSPKTWAVGDVLTAADLNTYVRDNLKALQTLTAGADTSFTPGTSYGDITGVSVTIPEDGAYDVEFGFYGSLTRAGNGLYAAPNGAGLTAADALAAILSSEGGGDNTSSSVTTVNKASVSRLLVNQSLTAGTLTLRSKRVAGSNGTGSMANVWLRVRKHSG